MKHAIFKAAFRILSILQIPKLLRRLIDEDRIQTCRSRATLGKKVRFTASARVLCPAGQESRITVSDGCLVDGELLVHDYGGKIEIGENTYLGMGSRIWSGESVKVGRHVLIAHNVNIADTNSHQLDSKERERFYIDHILSGRPFEKGSIETSPVEIGDYVWINYNVGILKGVKIGEGAIIGACSLVTKDVQPYTFVAGNPLREICKLPKRP